LAIAADASKLIAGNSIGEAFVCGSSNGGDDFTLAQEI
jgi:hypothetical protein